MMPEARILIVEDDPMMRRVLAAFARMAGHDYVIAENGADGLIAAESEPFMLILTDFNMARLNGLEMIEAIRDSRGPNSRTPIVMVTAADRALIYRRARLVGASDVLTKPISFESYSAAVALYARAPADEPRPQFLPPHSHG